MLVYVKGEMSVTLQSTMVHLDPSQKKALQLRAKQKGASMSSEIRQAITLYLSDVSPTELAVLDAATRQAEKDIGEMTASMQRTIALLDRTFAEIESIRGNREPRAA
jgi:plasmid stability protein